ncbi:MAG: GntR family transcriptional regulator, transcriptional repressor for pyruvate dehydrogenase complex [Thermoleophilaceae bacterium]|nr:GntR family transcriptional regulator, transcriptional repressor for pyruvate dehydrogenase complex [Thermoleophilaceae bacterium]
MQEHSYRLDRPKPRAQAVADALRDLVKEQRLVPGDRLPTEAELVDMLGVGRSSVREGVQMLQSLGIVEVEHGRGMFLAPVIGSGLRAVVNWAYVSADKDQLIYDLLEARTVVEPMQARLAAERATDAELQQLASFGDSDGHLPPQELSLSEAEVIGLDYHEFIARIAHNDILLIMSNAVRPLFISLVEELDRPTDEFTTLLKHHSGITEAVAARDGAEAERAMREHLEDNRRAVDRWIGRRDGGKPRRAKRPNPVS